MNGSLAIHEKLNGIYPVQSFNPTHLRKMNRYSINQIIRIRSDDRTTREIQKEFGQVQNEAEKVYLIKSIDPLFYTNLYYIFFSLKDQLGA